MLMANQPLIEPFFLGLLAISACRNWSETFHRPVLITFGPELICKVTAQCDREESPLIIAPPLDILSLVDPDAVREGLLPFVRRAFSEGA